jgi:hypothetical protein
MRKPRTIRLLVAGLALASLTVGRADGLYELQAQFDNPWWKTNGPATATLAWNGHSGPYRTPLTANNRTVPANNRFKLPWSSIGQPVAARRPDFRLGEPILPPPGVDLAAAPALISPSQSACYVPSRQTTIATDRGLVQIDWRMTDGSTNSRVYLISASPHRRPARIFWTQEPYNAPAVDLHGKFVTIHYNSMNPDRGTNGLWVDDQHMLRAAEGCVGMVVVEFFDTGSKTKQIGWEIVESLAPWVNLQTAFIGHRLLPVASYYGFDDLDADIRKGLPDLAYKHASVSKQSLREGWVFAIAPTVDSPWRLEIYWKHKGVADVSWPFEVDWYAADWPPDGLAQRYVRGGSATNAPVTIPSALNAELMSFQDPPRHATLSTDRTSFSTTGSSNGHALLKYSANDEVWFEVVHSVANTNNVFFNRDALAWPIGQELAPVRVQTLAQFGTSGASIRIPSAAQPAYTIEAWIQPAKCTNINLVIAKSAAEDSTRWTQLRLDAQGRLEHNVTLDNGRLTVTGSTSLEPNRWSHIAAAADAEGLIRVYLNGVLEAQAYAPSPLVQPSSWNLFLGPASTIENSAAFEGALRDFHVWNRGLSADELQIVMATRLEGAEPGLVHCLNFEAAGSESLRDLAQPESTAAPSPSGAVSLATTGTLPSASPWPGGPGYILMSEGTAYNPNYYAWPAADSRIFAVNRGVLEVWWTNERRQENMPEGVFWPSLVARYTNSWPASAPELVLAGQNSDTTGLLPDWFGDPSVYYQNNSQNHGFNPNEEHALLLAGQVYALRDDLNTASSSDPYVLVQYLDLIENQPRMQVFHVVETNAQYRFNQDVVAGTLLQPPMPITLLNRCTQSSIEPAEGPAWRDRKLDFWAVAAGDNGTTTAQVTARLYYPMQPGFFFPDRAQQPVLGTELPWLSRHGTEGTPIAYTYTIRWPDNVPTLHIGQTLADPTAGLPAIRGQKSVTVPYQQSTRQNSSRASVVLIDPTAARSVALDALPSDLTTETYAGKIFFPTLAPHLRNRLYYEPDRHLLTFIGSYNPDERALLINVLSGDQDTATSDRARVLSLSSNPAWSAAVANLATATLVIDDDRTPFDSLALTAGVGATQDVGYVALAFNNSTTLCAPADPISVEIIKVEPPLFRGTIRAIFSENPLDEKLTLRHSSDFAGRVQDYEFDWRTLPPDNSGMPPEDARNNWTTFLSGPGHDSITVEGPGIRTLTDNYFVCRYRPLESSGPTGSQWSDWTDPMLAEGWIKRVLNGINPFEQRIRNLQNNQVNTTVSLVSQAGARWIGDVPLNLQNINDYGLIEIYETVLKRGRMLSIDSGFDYGPANDALLLAAGRISDLYMILGNDAYADAQDPTISFNTSDQWEYGSAWSSLFCFMNQVPTLMDEELALLRGRDNTLQPSVHTYPFYNRLIWNFTKDIGGGEAAYALNYSLRNENGDADGTINESDARRLYPQGHGDAWGHYLTATTVYYHLLQNSNFTWIPRIEAKVLGGVTVSVDYFDERKFAAAAAAKARAGAEIVDLSHRQLYLETPLARLATGQDLNTNRAWGVAEWSCRAGQAALFDWAVANSLLPDTDPDPTHAGIQKVDRTTVPELKEITACLDNIQIRLDNADLGLNPLGLSDQVVPFDISPAGIDEGQTHFEQIYDRALVALNNATTVLGNAQYASMLLRRQANSQADLVTTLDQAERDYQNRLVEIFGYPYSDDIGPGKTYPQGYDGPDLYHFNYVEVLDLIGLAPPIAQTINLEVHDYEINLADFSYDRSNEDGDDDVFSTGNSISQANTRSIELSFSDTGFVQKPPTWSGRRRAQGELQTAYADVLQAYYALERARRDQNELYVRTEGAFADIQDQVASSNDALAWMHDYQKRFVNMTRSVAGLQATRAVMDLLGEYFELTADALKDSFPTVLGMANDTTSGIRAGVKTAGILTWYTSRAVGMAADVASASVESARDIEALDLENDLAELDAASNLIGPNRDAESLAREAIIQQVDLQAQVAALTQALERYRTVLASGQRLLAERTQFRARAATQVQSDRYSDLAFRVFRNDGLGKYRSAFDLAARYVYLAAQAYDYETALLRTDSTATSGSDFLSTIVRARSLGTLVDGVPQTGSATGDPGLADVMARMKANWDVLKGRFGFNNPANEFNEFSLRAELFRIASPEDPDALALSDSTWRNTLWNCKVDDLLELPSFRRYCLPFAPTAAPEPALVIPFSTCILARKNFFGWDIAGGDSSFDSSHFATKIRSVGVFFSNFNNAFGSGLHNTPRVYLIPIGQDIQRSPTDQTGTARLWRVTDQALPVPYDLDVGRLNEPDWIPLIDEVAGGFAAIRKYPSLRAYHDSGQFDADQLCTNSRLVGRSVWNTQWLLIIPASTLHSDTEHALKWFIDGADGDGNGVKDIKLLLQTYSYSGN